MDLAGEPVSSASIVICRDWRVAKTVLMIESSEAARRRSQATAETALTSRGEEGNNINVSL